MATKTAKGRITGLLALTCEGAVALNVGDPTMVSAAYTVVLCDGSKPCLGTVTVANVKRGTDGQYPVANAGGDVTVDALGLYVRAVTAGGIIGAGVSVGYGAGGTLVVAGAGVSTVGIALMPAAAAGVLIDVLFK